MIGVVLLVTSYLLELNGYLIELSVEIPPLPISRIMTCPKTGPQEGDFLPPNQRYRDISELKGNRSGHHISGHSESFPSEVAQVVA